MKILLTIVIVLLFFSCKKDEDQELSRFYSSSVCIEAENVPFCDPAGQEYISYKGCITFTYISTFNERAGTIDLRIRDKNFTAVANGSTDYDVDAITDATLPFQIPLTFAKEVIVPFRLYFNFRILTSANFESTANLYLTVDRNLRITKSEVKDMVLGCYH